MAREVSANNIWACGTLLASADFHIVARSVDNYHHHVLAMPDLESRRHTSLSHCLTPPVTLCIEEVFKD